MPKQTFINLPEAKKVKIIKAAINEMSKHRFEDISINKIIKEAKIPRGSFYQYFEDMSDLYAYVLKIKSKDRLDGIEGATDIIEYIIKLVNNVAEMISKNPKLAKIFVQMQLSKELPEPIMCIRNNNRQIMEERIIKFHGKEMARMLTPIITGILDTYNMNVAVRGFSMEDSREILLRDLELIRRAGEIYGKK